MHCVYVKNIKPCLTNFMTDTASPLHVHNGGITATMLPILSRFVLTTTNVCLVKFTIV